MNRWRVLAWLGLVVGVAGVLLRDVWLPGGAEPRPPSAPARAPSPKKAPAAPEPSADGEAEAVAPRPEPRPDARNVVLVTLDTVRADFLQPHGASLPTSPFLLALAKRGVTFDNAYATSNWTTPSMASLMTSLYPKEHDLVLALASVGRAQQRALPAEALTLAEMMRAQGYATFGVTTNLLLTKRFGFDQGFDHFLGEVTAQMPFPRMAVESLHDAITGSEAYFLWVHYFDPHWPYLEQAPWFHTWNDSGFGGVGDFAADVVVQMYRRENSLPPDAPIPPQAIPGLHLRTQGWALDPSGLLSGIPELASGDAGGMQAVDAYLRYLRAAYRSELRAVDADLERVLEGLGVDDETLVIVTADHGEEFLEHGKLGHGSFSLHQELIRVPLIVRLPGGRHAGKVIEAPVSLVDIAPSLLELLELPVPDGLSGKSFADLLDGASAEPRSLVAERSGASGEAHRCVIRYPWKYAHDFQTGEGLLYQLEDDPQERKNLVAEQPERADELRAWLTAWAAETDRRWPEREPAVMSPADVLMLRALGYAGAD